MRDGYIDINGLQADFKFVRGHVADNDMAWVETATGESWVKNTDLHWDNTTQEKPQVKCEGEKGTK